MLKPTLLARLEGDVVLVAVIDVVAICERDQTRTLRELSRQISRVEIIDRIELWRDVERVRIDGNMFTQSAVLTIVVPAMKGQSIVRVCVRSVCDEQCVAAR